ncbi:hypothetical protein V9T40_012690 [Parthenolecanium corni]|uniref:RNA helicase n=1 Tax=Parthenolecanium corni TaxID=536013 RepID=A0AAN9TBA4_9HEMI
MASAQTGSGKTAAFLLPIIHQLLEKQNVDPDDGSGCRPSAVILSPTRQLTTQIYEVGRKFARGSIVKVQQIYSGTSVSYQISQLQRGCHILIATPGRLGDFLNRGVLNFSGVRFVVLDEADRMLDMGFRGEMEKFLNYEKFEEVERTHKKSKLKEVLDKEEDVQGTFVFVGQKRNADFVASYLSGLKILTTSIHGDRFQSEREEALRDFRSRKMKILVATSVDIKGVTHVINFDLPDSIDEFVHRIGRAGRLGNKGKATSFYDSSADSSLVNNLVQILKQAGQPVPDFLSRDATGGGSYQDDKFGGQDYRSRNKGNGYKTDARNMPVQFGHRAVPKFFRHDDYSRPHNDQLHSHASSLGQYKKWPLAICN